MDAGERDDDLYAQIFAHAAIGMGVITTEGTWAIANPRLCTMLGYSDDELNGWRVLELIHPDDVTRVVEIGAAALAGDFDVYRCDCRFLHADGFVVWTRVSVSVARGADGAARLIAQVEDITDFRATRSVLAEVEQRFRAAFQHAPIGMALADLDGRWSEVNDALCTILGYPREQLLTMGFADVTHPDDIRTDHEHIASLLEGRQSHSSAEKRYIHADGHVVWVNRSVSVVRGETGAPLYFIAQMHNVTQQRLANERLAHMATHDALTGLANRVLLLERIRAAQAAADIDGAHVGVVFVDLKGFKALNDQHGHQAGDEVLARIGRRLASIVHPADTAARLGGDEFVICLAGLDASPGVAEQQTAAAVKRIVAAVDAPVDLLGNMVNVTAAVGVALCRGAAEAANTLLRRADQAMYDSRR